MVVHKLFVVSLAVLMTALAPGSPARAADPEFTPLDEIERVRQAGCGIGDFEEFLAWYSSATTGGGWLEQVIFTSWAGSRFAMALRSPVGAVRYGRCVPTRWCWSRCCPRRCTSPGNW